VNMMKAPTHLLGRRHDNQCRRHPGNVRKSVTTECTETRGNKESNQELETRNWKQRLRVFQFTVMLSAFASLRVNSAKHLALLFLGGKAQSEILRSAPLRSE
jgi:hypothetical protein